MFAKVLLNDLSLVLPTAWPSNHDRMYRLFLGTIFLLFFIGCASSKKGILNLKTEPLDSAFFQNQFTGFFAVDAASRDTLYNLNGQKYFTPASNTKIFTLYTAMRFLPNRIPALKHLQKQDTLYIMGTGDPSLLHPHVKDTTVLRFLQNFKHVALNLNNLEDEKFGPGWAWGDYQYYYQPEVSPLPLYGNVVSIHGENPFIVRPDYFKDSVLPIRYSKRRELERNLFYYANGRRDTVEIPYRIDTTLTRILLEDALGKKIRITDRMPEGTKNILPGISADTLYRRMMHESDNLIAEQLLLLASSTLSDTLSGQRVRDSILAGNLKDLKSPPRWVDGSGLSRYNLFTPESIVHVLSKMYAEIDRKRLFSLFPAGGESGTLEDWYPGNPDPYLYAKTGSLSNNHCISGYLLTKSGKTVIFSFMNNHFRPPSSEVKKRMQRIFERIRDTY